MRLLDSISNTKWEGISTIFSFFYGFFLEIEINKAKQFQIDNIFAQGFLLMLRSKGMSRQLHRLKSLVSDIDQIQRQGQKRVPSTPVFEMLEPKKTNNGPTQSITTPIATQHQTNGSNQNEIALQAELANRLESMTSNQMKLEASVANTLADSMAELTKNQMQQLENHQFQLSRLIEPILEKAAQEAAAVKQIAPEVSMQLTGDVTLKFQVAETQEIIEVRRRGEMLEIGFSDGKSVHLPLKSIA
jgi:hypothetical protein